jgi:aminopeptidase
MNHIEKLQEYARLMVRTGVNVQKDQSLVLNCSVENYEFGRLIVKEAYEAGAKEVVVFWNDVKVSRLRYDYAAIDLFKTIPEWQVESRNYYANKKAAVISVIGSDPQAYLGVDSEKLKVNSRTGAKAFEAYYKKMMNSEFQWCVAAVPEANWAKKVFPGISEEMALEKLWDAIFDSVRIGKEDAVEAWDNHNQRLREKTTRLNEYHFEALEYKNSIGTNFRVGLQKDHIWEGGGEYTSDQIYFIANMPTEEIFTTPDCYKAEGKLVSSVPLCYQGNLIENFSITFHDGKVIDYDAEKGYDILKMIVETDQGSNRLGEVALVPFDSPIANTGILFYDTLFDENASCHFALGKCYPTTIKDGGKMTEEELQKIGANHSNAHVDFMVGTQDLEITGITKEGKKILVFENGNWTI